MFRNSKQNYHCFLSLLDVNHPGEDKQTALHYAAKYKKARAMKKSTTAELNADGDNEDSQPNNIQVGWAAPRLLL